MKRVLVWLLAWWVLLPFAAQAKDVVVIGQAKAVDESVKLACELAREQALLQAKQEQTRLVRSQVTLIEREQDGVVSEMYEARTNLYQMVEVGFVVPPETRKALLGDRVECTVLNAKVWVDASELEKYKQTLASENKLRQTQLAREAQLMAELNENELAFIKLKQQANRFSNGGYDVVHFCLDNWSRNQCMAEAKILLEQQKAEAVAGLLRVDVVNVGVKMTSDLHMVEGDQKLNGRDYLLKGIAQYNIALEDPYSSRNQQIRQQLAVLRNQPEPSLADATKNANLQSEGFRWHPALIVDSDIAIFNREKPDHASGIGVFGLKEDGAISVGDFAVGLRFKPGNRYFGAYLGVAIEEWALCTKAARKICTEVEQEVFMVQEVGANVSFGNLTFQLTNVFMPKNSRLGGNDLPRTYQKWVVSVGPGDEYKIRMSLGKRIIPGILSDENSYMFSFGFSVDL